MNTQDDIRRVCDSVKELLLEKNAKYGDSALDPVRTFSKASAVEQILVRIDDKLSRISRGAGIVGDDEDVIQDLIGYLVLLTIALERQNEPTQETDGTRVYELAERLGVTNESIFGIADHLEFGLHPYCNTLTSDQCEKIENFIRGKEPFLRFTYPITSWNSPVDNTICGND